MIGLVDYDILTPNNKNMLIPNLEIMKLATYYKLEENLFCRMVGLEETDLSMYKKIFFFSEVAEQPAIPPAFLQAKNVVFGGTAFTKKKYIPFENSIIDFTIPKPFIYKNFLQEQYQLGLKTNIISHVLDDSCYRMRAGDNILPIPPIMKRKRVFLFDRDFFIPECKKIMNTITARAPSSIIPIHPIICHTVSEFFLLREITKISRNAIIILDINIPLHEVYYLFKRYQKFFLAEIVPNSSVYLNLGGSFSTDFQYFKNFIYKLNLLYHFWSHDIPLKLRYDMPMIGFTDPLMELSKLAASWTEGETRNKRTLDERMHHHIDKNLSKIVVEQKMKLLNFYPETKNLFFQNYTTLKEGGWKYEY